MIMIKGNNADFYISNEKRLLPIKEDSKNAVRYLCVFPDFYEYGLPNIGLQTIYRECYYHKDVIPDRYYLPQESWETKELTWEQKKPAKDSDIIGFTISYEGSYVNVLKCIEYFGIQSCSKLLTNNNLRCRLF